MLEAEVSQDYFFITKRKVFVHSYPSWACLSGFGIPDLPALVVLVLGLDLA